jgi:hypothetical protein
MFKYDWSRFDASLGLIFMFALMGVYYLMALEGVLSQLGLIEFPVFAAGTSALLAWCTVILVPALQWRQHLLGLITYLGLGVALTWLAALVAPHPTLQLGAMGIVVFAAYFALRWGAHAFMLGWCLAYWYLLAPLFLGGGAVAPVAFAHVVGAGVVLALNLLKPIWMRASAPGEAAPDADTDVVVTESPPLGLILRYASIVSISIIAGVAAGAKFLTTDPTIIANATINVVSPSLAQTWRSSVERVILGTLGIVGGFYCGWFFPDPWVGNLVTAISAFMGLALIHVSFSLTIAFFFVMIAYPWGTMQSDAAHLIANEKLIGELLGVVVAVLAIALLMRLERRD